MRVTATRLPEVLLIEPRVFEDGRGYFKEIYEARQFAAAGIALPFVQDNESKSRGGTLRGLHYQLQHPQGKLVRVISGEIFDVAVDVRRNSSTFGQWVGVTMTATEHQQIYVPPGFAHGFYVMSEIAVVAYKCTDYYFPEHERTLLWNDPQLGIEWPIAPQSEPILSKKDRAGRCLRDAEVFA